MKKLADSNVEVIGVSGDSVKNQQIFKEAHQLNFTLLADEDGSVAKKFGVPLGRGGVFKTKDAAGQAVDLKRGVTAARWTFVIDKNGKIASMDAKVKAVDDGKTTLELAEKLAK